MQRHNITESRGTNLGNSTPSRLIALRSSDLTCGHRYKSMRLLVLTLIIAFPTLASAQQPRRDGRDVWLKFERVPPLPPGLDPEAEAAEYYQSRKTEYLRKLKVEPHLRFKIFTNESPEVAENVEASGLSLKSEKPFEATRFEKHPILVLRFEDRAAQGLMFDRMYAFVESPVHHGAILKTPTAEELVNFRGGSAYDFKMSDVAAFFNKARNSNIALNIAETNLRDELIKGGVLKKKNGDVIIVQESALVSVASGASPEDVAHELNHAVYFIDKEYRDCTEGVMSSLTEEEKKLTTSVMSLFRSYNRTNVDLIKRETVAYFRDPNELFKAYLRPNRSLGSVSDERIPIASRIATKLRRCESNSTVYKDLNKTTRRRARSSTTAK